MHAKRETLGWFEVEEFKSVDDIVAATDYCVRDESFVVRVEGKFDSNHFAGEKVSLCADTEADLTQIVAVAAKREVAVSAGNSDNTGLRVSIAQGLPAAGNFADGATIHDFAIDEDAVWLGAELGWANCHQTQCG
jgi:hypothetical protein